MATELQEEVKKDLSQVNWDEWKIKFCDHFENKLRNPEEIADYIVEGMLMENFEVVALCVLLSTCIDASINSNLCEDFSNLGKGLLTLFSRKRNINSFLCKWNLEFVAAKLNHSFLMDEDFQVFLPYLNALPRTPKVLKQVNDSPLFANVLSKFIDCEDMTQLSNYICIISYLSAGNAFVSEVEKLLISEAKDKSRKMRTTMITQEEMEDLSALEIALNLCSDHRNMAQQKRDQINENIRKNFRKQLPAKCCNKNCSKSTSFKAKYCAKCLFPCYCSQKCQRAHWKVHKKECRILTKIGKNLVPLLNEAVQFLKETS